MKKSVMDHSFSVAPSVDIPRSTFDRSHTVKTTHDAGWLIPVFLDEVIPGDTVSLRPSVLARLATPLFPIMDNIYYDIHFFFVPIRQVWTNWRKFCGEQEDPGDSIDFSVPTANATASTGYANNTLPDRDWETKKK